MELNILLVKSITLLYRESQLLNKTENSSDLVRTVITSIGKDKDGITLKPKQILLNLRDTALEMCNSPIDHEFAKEELLLKLKLDTRDDSDDGLYEVLKQGVEDEIPENQLKRNIVNLRKSINNHFKEQTIQDIINGASYEFKFHRERIKDVNEYITKLISQLEPLQLNTSSKDPAVISDIDLGNEQSVKDVFTDIQKINTGTRLYKTGWQDLNTALQGGFRPGETTIIGALQHKYKTGFSLSLFAQIAQFNKPQIYEGGKKPLLLRISFEDDITSNLQFLYQYLKYDETLESVEIKDISTDEMTEYVRTKLQATGFHIKMMRVDPSSWTYKSICNKIIDLEAQGYVTEVLMTDYLMKVPTIGCVVSGPMGSDVMDQLSRIRMFCSSKGITYINPHQLSTEAKGLIRSGVPEEQFVKEIAEKGYWERTKGLDRVYDLCLLIHLFKHQKETYFSIYREKHRVPTIIDEEKKYMLFKFPKGMPIPSDVHREKISFRKLSQSSSLTNSESDKLFSF